MNHVTLVRVDTTWHAFSDIRQAWEFYTDWRELRDCELIGEVPVDVDV